MAVVYGGDELATGVLYEHIGSGVKLHLLRRHNDVGTFKRVEPSKYTANGVEIEQWTAICSMDNVRRLR